MEAPQNPQSAPQTVVPRLILEVDEASVELCLSTNAALADADEDTDEVERKLTLGRDDANQLVWDGEFTSRNHAYIEIQRNDFYLVDASANGTFVQTEDEQIHYVHRNSVRLWGVGWISLGEPLHARKPILFREVVPA